MASNFKRISTILERWPLDHNKAGRDVGQFLRDFLQQSYKSGKLQENPQHWDRQYLALQRLVNNEHQNKYPRVLQSSATGLTLEQCSVALSNEFLEELEQEEQPMYKKIFSCRALSQAAQVAMEAQPKAPHVPVMLHEVLNYLKPSPTAANEQLILDGTFGAGGHSRKLLESSENCRILALDRDPLGVNYAEELRKEYPDRVTPLLGKFSDLPTLLHANGIRQNSLDGVLFDFGCSSMQFDEATRGFSISKDGPLDMRMTNSPDVPTAADVLASTTEEDLYRIIKYYGEEKQARKIARSIIEARYLFKRLSTTRELADLVQSACSEDIVSRDKLQRPSHVATKTFQALRIFVNNELNEINYGLILASKYLKIGGRLVTITFHSLEDTIVKRHMSGNVIANSANPLPLKFVSHSLNIDKEVVQESMESNWKMLHKHVLVPSFDEVEANPRSRSAKLRAAVRIR